MPNGKSLIDRYFGGSNVGSSEPGGGGGFGLDQLLTGRAGLATGAVAAIGYAQVLYLLPISLFAMSVAAAELPGGNLFTVGIVDVDLAAPLLDQDDLGGSLDVTLERFVGVACHLAPLGVDDESEL